MNSYTWTEYDPREGGVQVIKDGFNNVQITAEFLKVPGGDHGGSWAVRVKGEPIDKGKHCSYLFVLLILPFRAENISHVSTIFYFGLEGLGGLELETHQDQDVCFFIFNIRSL